MSHWVTIISIHVLFINYCVVTRPVARGVHCRIIQINPSSILNASILLDEYLSVSWQIFKSLLAGKPK